MPPSKDRMWTAWFMETQFNILANELDYLENHSDESILRLKEANPSPVVNNQRLHILLRRERRHKFNWILKILMSCQTINLIKYKQRTMDGEHYY